MDLPKHHKENKNKLLSTFAKLSGVGVQMGATIFLGNFAGSFLDKKFNTAFLEETLTLLAVFLATYSLIKVANKLNK